MHAMDFPPYGLGMSPADAAKWVTFEFKDLGTCTRNAATGQYHRIVKAMEAAEA